MIKLNNTNNKKIKLLTNNKIIFLFSYKQFIIIRII